MKKLLTIGSLIVVALMTLSITEAQLTAPIGDDGIYTSDIDEIVNDDYIDDDVNPIRQGTQKVIDGVDGPVVKDKIDNFSDAQGGLLDIIRTFINYAL
jgi:hypothetical protein